MDNYVNVQFDESNIEEIKQSVEQIFGGEKTVVESGLSYIVVRMGHSTDVDTVGDYMIQWKYIPADKEYTIMAQQMKVDEDKTSLRQWNPERLDVPWGEDNGNIISDDKEKS